MFNQTVVENELTDRLGHRVKFSREVYFAENFDFFRKIFVDGKEADIRINMDGLQEAHDRGTIEEKYNEIATEINSYLLTERQQNG